MITVYTALFGGYDHLHPAPDLPDTRYVAFTDNPDLTADNWEIRVHPRASPLTPWMNSKLYKLLPHIVLPDARRTLYLDASHEITSPTAVQEALACARVHGFAVHLHPEGTDCLYDEAAQAATFYKYEGIPVLEQSASYAREGHPAHSGLWATGSIARIRSPWVDSLCEEWWTETLKWTPNCQMSLARVLHKEGVQSAPDIFPHNQYRSPWFKIHPHLVEVAV